jgi:aspartate aminotransferase
MSVAVYKPAPRPRAGACSTTSPACSCRAPGAFYLFVNCGGLIGRTTPPAKSSQATCDVALYLLEREGVAMIPGSSYGVAPYFRMSIATAIEVIEEGCRRIARAVAALR